MKVDVGCNRGDGSTGGTARGATGSAAAGGLLPEHAPGRPGLSTTWWLLLLAGGVLPALFSVATGSVIDAIDTDGSLRGPLTVVGVVFVALQVIGPVHLAVGQSLGRRTADHLNDRLIRATNGPAGIAHLEDPARSAEMAMARDFDLGITGPHCSWPSTSSSVGSGPSWPAWPARSSWPASPGGRRWSWSRAGAPPTGSCGRAGCGRTVKTEDVQHRPAPRRLRLPPGRRRPGGQGGPVVRTGGLGGRPLRRPVDDACTSCSGRRPGCGSGRWLSSLAVVVAVANMIVFWRLTAAVTAGRLR